MKFISQPQKMTQDRLWTQRNQWQCPFIVVSYQDIINLKQKLDNQCLYWQQSF